MRWDQLESSTRSAMILAGALLGLGVVAVGLAFKLDESWPLFVFFVALFPVLIFLAAVSLWQHLTAPKLTSLTAFTRSQMFQIRDGRRWTGISRWVIARDICLLALLAAMAAFVIHSFTIGGDAVRGYERTGQFFVRLHTHETKVTAAQWQWNLRLAVAVFALLPVTLGVTLIATFKERHDRFRYLDLDLR